MPRLLALERLSKRYDARSVLAPTDLALDEGDFVLLVGENGAGKTTLLRLLAGTLPASGGRVQWADGAEGAEARRRTAYVAHQPLLYHELTPVENLRFTLQVYGRPDPEAAAQEALESFGVGHRAREPVARLSRGQQQRVALARAFAAAPRLLLLDEPGTSLDADGRALLLRQLERVRGTCTVLLATHDPESYRALATRAWRLGGGRLNEVAA